MAILMVAMLAFGGTYAYFTSTAGTAFDSSTNAGIIKLSANGDVFTATSTLTQDVLPGEPLVTLGANDFVCTIFVCLNCVLNVC